jgi:hypothetical protein
MRIPESEIIVPKGNVQLLMGMNHLSLHTKEVERTGSLSLLLSFFGTKTGWIVAGNLAEMQVAKHLWELLGRYIMSHWIS